MQVESQVLQYVVFVLCASVPLFPLVDLILKSKTYLRFQRYVIRKVTCSTTRGAQLAAQSSDLDKVQRKYNQQVCGRVFVCVCVCVCVCGRSHELWCLCEQACVCQTVPVCECVRLCLLLCLCLCLCESTYACACACAHDRARCERKHDRNCEIFLTEQKAT